MLGFTEKLMKFEFMNKSSNLYKDEITAGSIFILQHFDRPLLADYMKRKGYQNLKSVSNLNQANQVPISSYM